MKQLWPRLLVLTVLAVAGFGMWSSFRPTPDAPVGRVETGAQSAPVAVEVAPVTRGWIRDVHRFTGSLEPAAQFEVAPQVGGHLERLLVDIGDRVRKGEVIAHLNDAEHVQEVAQAQAEVAVAEATRAEASSTLDARQRELARIQELHREQIASEAQLEATQAEVIAQQARVQLAEAQIAQSEAALRAAEVRLSYATIHAEWRGNGAYRVVGERFVDEGTTISANTPIVSVLDIQELIGVAFATERDYAQLRMGQKVSIVADALPNRTFAGEIVRLAPLFQETSRQARIEIRIPNKHGALKPGMFVSARVQLEIAYDAAIVPWDSLVNRKRGQGVFVVDRAARRARFVPVSTGIVEDERVQIVAPRLHHPVVVLGQHLLSDGSAVVISAPNEPARAGVALSQSENATP